MPNKVKLEIIFQAYGASHEDFGIILHMDKGPHHIMNYAKDFDRLPILEQEGLALLVSDLGTLHTDTWVYKNSKHEFCVFASKHALGVFMW